MSLTPLSLRCALAHLLVLLANYASMLRSHPCGKGKDAKCLFPLGIELVHVSRKSLGMLLRHARNVTGKLHAYAVSNLYTAGL